VGDYTPGPWELREGWEEVFGPGIYTPGAHDMEPHAAVSQFAADPDADARLIAAAPDLLAALEQIVADNDGYCYRCEKGNDHGPSCPIPTARAAIAKAKGEA